MADQWYYTRGGQQAGPVTYAELRQLATSGQLSPKDLVWTEGMANWAAAETIENLFAPAPAPAASIGELPKSVNAGNKPWFYARNGQQNGPIPMDQLQQMARTGQLMPQELVWTEGMANWVPAQSLPEFFPPLQTNPTPTPRGPVQPITPAMAAGQWFYVQNGQQSGAVAFVTLQEMASNGQLAPDQLVWCEGLPNWLPASDIENLMPPGAANIPMAQPVQLAYQGPNTGYGGMGPRPSNHLVFAIIMIFCCFPFAIPAIVYAAQVNGKYQSGDYAGAVRASENAKKWAIIALAVGLGIRLIQIIIAVAANTR